MKKKHDVNYDSWKIDHPSNYSDNPGEDDFEDGLYQCSKCKRYFHGEDMKFFEDFFLSECKNCYEKEF